MSASPSRSTTPATARSTARARDVGDDRLDRPVHAAGCLRDPVRVAVDERHARAAAR
jgi:hypothetical protein